MGNFVFTSPTLAGLAVVLPVIILALRLVLRRRVSSSIALHLVCSLAACLILLSLAGPEWRTRSRGGITAIFALDASASIPRVERERALAEAAAMASILSGKGVKVEFVDFDETVVNRREGPTFTTVRETPLPVAVRSSKTSRIVPVLLHAHSRVGRGERARLFLFTDGRFSDVPPAPEPPRGLAVHAFPLRPRTTVDISIPSIEFRPPLEEGTPTTATVEVMSNAAGQGVVTLYRKGKRIGAREILLEPGRAKTVEFADIGLSRGTHRISARFESREEGLPDSSPTFVDVRVEGPPAVLLLDRTPPRGLPLLEALRAQGVELTGSAWKTVGDLESLETFDAFILVSPPPAISRDDFSARLARAVKGGGGLIVVADETGFGPSYRDSPLGLVSPVIPPEPHVEPPPPDPEDDPPPEEPDPPEPVEEKTPPEEEDPPTERKPVEIGSVALVFLIDKSGSMGGQKIRLAKEAAIAAASTIEDRDSIGVLAFDTEATWIVPMTSAGRREWITDQIARLQAGGGTNIFPALVKALTALKELPARIRHVILISDGYNKTLEDFKGVVSNMTKAGITLSTIGVGEQFDSRLLSSLTYWAGGKKGRFDFTRDPERIPRLVIQQTRWALGKTDETEEPPDSTPPPPPPPDPPPTDPEPPHEDPPDPQPPDETPPPPTRLPLRIALTHPSPPFRGIREEDLPPLYGLRNAKVGPLADILARGPKDEPVMVLGEHGLGKVLYVGTSMTGKWGADWQAWEDLPKWIGQALRWVKRRPEKPLPPRVVFSRLPGGGLEALVKADPGAVAPEEPPRLTLKSGAGGDSVPIPILRSGTHDYRGQISPQDIRPPTTLRVAFPPGAGAVPLETEVPVPVPVPFERIHGEPDEECLRVLATSSRGMYSPSMEKATRLSPGWQTDSVSLWWIPLCAALPLVPLSAFLRRRRSDRTAGV
jgi:Mg-chelatase subunit ChlD